MGVMVHMLRERGFGEFDKGEDWRVDRIKSAEGFARARRRATGLRRDRRNEAAIDGLVRDQRQGVVVVMTAPDGSHRELYVVYEDRH